MIGERRIKIPLVPKRIGDLTGRPGPSHRRVWAACVNEEFPAELGTIGRWTVGEDDLPAMAAVLGLTSAARAAA